MNWMSCRICSNPLGAVRAYVKGHGHICRHCMEMVLRGSIEVQIPEGSIDFDALDEHSRREFVKWLNNLEET